MLDVPDYELDKTEPESPPPAEQPGRPTRRIAAVVALIIIGIAAYIWYSRAGGPPTDTAPVTAPPATATARPAPPLIDVPPLDESDAVVRRLIGALSSHPHLAAWLATRNLIRTMAVVVENIDTGASPSRHLAVLRPTGRFLLEGQGAALAISTRNYARFDSLGDAAASIDTAGAATLYAGLKPRLEEAYRELGHQDGFDAPMKRAVAVLLEVPVIDTAVPLVPGQGASYDYATSQLQDLTDAQRQLLRMGPRNVRLIQKALESFRSAALP